MTPGREWLFSGDPLHQSVETYLCEQLQGLTFARNKLADIEKQIQGLMQERENILYEIEVREANVEQTQQRMAECKLAIRERWFDIRKRYNIAGGDPLSLISLLPVELLVCIFRFLAPYDLCKAMLVSKLWRDVSSSDTVWSHIYKNMWGEVDDHTCEVCCDLTPAEKQRDHTVLNAHRRGVKIGGQRLRDSYIEDDEMLIDTMEEPKLSTKRTTWMVAFIHRQAIENNWKTGRCGMHTFVGHTDWVTCIGVHHSRMISGSWDSFLKIWDLDSKECIASLSGHTAGINDLDIHPAGNVFVSASLDCTLRVWDMHTYKCLWTLEGHTDQVSFAKFSLHPAHVVSTSLDGTVRLWNLDAGKCIAVLEGHTSGITAMCVRDKYTITGATDGTIIVWDTTQSRMLHILSGHTDRITAIQLDLESQRVVSVSWDSTVRVWDFVKGTCVRVLTGHIFRIRCVDICGDTLVSGAWDNEAKVWDIKTGQCRQTLSGHGSYVWATQLTARCRRAVTGSWDHSIRVWDLTNTKCLYTLDHTSEVLCMQMNSHRLIGASKDIRVWDFSVGCEM